MYTEGLTMILAHDSDTTTIAVVGAGAAGCMAAITAAQHGVRVLLFDTADRPARKICITGNGKCNITNNQISDECWHTNSDTVRPMDFLQEYGADDLLRFFTEHGVYFHDRNGYIYPRTDKASTIADVLERLISRTPSIITHYSHRILSVSRNQDHLFTLKSAGESYRVSCVILTCGGMVYERLGCRGDAYQIAEKFGHHVKRAVPALCPLQVDDPWIRAGDKARCAASVSLYVDHTPVCSDTGELQLADTALSGIPVFQVSRYASRALADGRDVDLIIDFLPEFTDTMWQQELKRRLAAVDASDTLADLFTGLVDPKIGSWMIRSEGLADEKKICNLQKTHKSTGPKDTKHAESPGSKMISKECRAYLVHLLQKLRSYSVHVTGSASFEKAQVTGGGILLNEVNPRTMESLLVPGMYFAGEELDADGKCGGYNLTFAMCTGMSAGAHAADSLHRYY